MTSLQRFASSLAVAVGLALGLGRSLPGTLGTSNERALPGLDAVRVFGPGETSHVVYVPLRAGDHVRIAAEQRGSDVVLEVLAPGEREPLSIDGFTDTTGIDDFELIARESGTARVRLVLGRPGAWTPAYRLVISPPRPAGPAERLRASAYGAIEQAKALPREQAIPLLERALGEAVQARAPDLEALVHDRMARRFPTDDPARVGHFRAAALRAVDPRLRCAETRSLGLSLRDRDEMPAAVEALRRELEMALRLGDPIRIAFAQQDLAGMARGASHFDEALERNLRALSLWRRVGDREQQALSLKELAATSIELGDPDQAQKDYQAALDVPGLDPALRIRLLDGLAHALRRSERWGPARETGNRALAAALRRGDRALEAGCRLTLASIELDTGRPNEALRHLVPTQRIFEHEIDDPWYLANTYAMIGPALERSGDVAGSLGYFDRAIDGYRRLGNDAARAWVLSHRSDALRRAGRLDEARADLEAAIKIVECMRPALAPKTRADLLADRHAFFEQLIDLLIEQGRMRAAFEASERSRGRTLLDQVGGGEISPRTLDQIRSDLPPSGVLLEYSLGAQRSILFVVRREGLSWVLLPPQKRIEEQIGRANRAFDRAPGTMRREEREAAIAELAATLLAPVSRRLVGGPIVVVPDGALFSVPFAALPISDVPGGAGPRLVDRGEVVTLPSASLALEIRAAVARRPVAEGGTLAVADPVFGCPDPRLPCPEGGAEPKRSSLSGSLSGSLSDEWAAGVRSLLGSERAAGRRRGEASGGALIRISRTGSEAEAIVKLAGAGSVTVRRGFEASRKGVLGVALERFRILHFATHGLVDPEQPDRSGLALSEVDAQGRAIPGDSFFRLGDLSSRRLRADLVVLSACESAVGKEKRGEGPQSLGRAFLAAGAANALVSLWRVDDSSTEELMVEFYRQLLASGRSPAEALRRSQLAIRSRAGWSDPYYWGAFVLQGDWAGPPGARPGVREARRP